MNDFTYESPEEKFNRRMEEVKYHREQIDLAEESMKNSDIPLGVQVYEEERFQDHTFLTSIPPEEYLKEVGTLAEESFEAFFHHLRVEADLQEAKIKADFKKGKSWGKIAELIGISVEELDNPETPSYEMAWDPENKKVMFFSKEPTPSNEAILRALLGK